MTISRAFLVVMMLAVPAMAQAQSPVAELTDLQWQSVLKNVAEAKDADDPGKMIYYWIKATAGNLTQEEYNQLKKLSQREGRRAWAAADQELYTTMMAVLILKVHEIKQETQRDRLEHDNMKKIVIQLCGILDVRIRPTECSALNGKQ